MRSRLLGWLEHTHPISLRVWGAVIWLIAISGAHYWLNFDHGTREVVNMGYMPVVTNMAAPLLDYTSQEGDEVRFKAMKFSSFAEMGEALRNDKIQVGFMIAPLSIVLRQQGEDVKVVMVGNRHESTLVARKELGVKNIDGLAGRTVAVPMRFSGHNLALRRMIEERGMSADVNIVEMNPPDMAAALDAGVLDAYFVGEPFAAKTIKEGKANVVAYVEDYWPRFMCNVVVVRQSLIDRDPGLVARMVESATRANLWAKDHPEQAAKILSKYWNQPEEFVLWTLTNPPGRFKYDMYEPVEQEFQEMAQLMVRYKLVEKDEIGGLVEPRFTKQANVSGVTDLRSVVRGAR